MSRTAVSSMYCSSALQLLNDDSATRLRMPWLAGMPLPHPAATSTSTAPPRRLALLIRSSETEPALRDKEIVRPGPVLPPCHRIRDADLSDSSGLHARPGSES